jgi:Ras-related protein Rab-6A/Rab family protein
MKVIFVGSAAVGKTSLIYRFVNDQFNDSLEPSLQPGQQSITVDIPDKPRVDLVVWDTAGQEKFQALNQLYYRDAAVGCICYCPLDLQSAESILSWRGDLLSESPNCKLILVATKADLLEGHDIENPSDVASQNNISESVLTSAKTGEGVNTLFAVMGRLASTVPVAPPVSTTIADAPTPTPPKKQCCG